MAEPRVACRTPTKGRDGATNIPEWKFNLLRDAIHTVLTKGDVPFSKLTDHIRPLISEDELARLGSLGWHTTSVKLELEVRGEIERVAGSKPQVLRLSAGNDVGKT